MKKVYKTFAAVDDTNFCVKKGEVFGLLGPNGAGKSTIFNMLTMDLKRSSANAKILHRLLDRISVFS